MGKHGHSSGHKNRQAVDGYEATGSAVCQSGQLERKTGRIKRDGKNARNKSQLHS